MKTKYLTAETKHNLRILKKTTDPEVIAQTLEAVFQRPMTMQEIWEYRQWFLGCTEEQLEKNPALRWGKARILVMQGRLEKARQELEKLPEGPYKAISALSIPGTAPETVREAIRAVRENGWTLQRNMPLTAGRPSVFNGMWDLSAYKDELLSEHSVFREVFACILPEEADVIMDLLQAEQLYQRNDSYDALVLAVARTPMLKDKQDMRLLFVALTVELYVLLMNGQATAAGPVIDNLRSHIIANGMEAYLANIDAMEAWAAMYDGDHTKVVRWLREGAPDEYKEFCMLDLFRYMVKLRAYLIQGKHLAVTSLAGRLSPLLEKGNRYMDMCELQLLWAMSDHADGREQEALDHMSICLALAQEYRFDRLIADEGQKARELLQMYRRYRGDSVYLERLLGLTQRTAELYPQYLNSHLMQLPSLTETEMRVLRLLAACLTNAEIGQRTGTAIDTVKQHCRHIFAKLNVKNRQQAVQKANEIGLL